MAEKVISLNGGPLGKPQPNADCIRALEDWLEKARSGQIIGVGMVGLGFNDTGQWAVAGVVGGFSMVGALEIVRDELVKIVRGECTCHG